MRESHAKCVRLGRSGVNPRHVEARRQQASLWQWQSSAATKHAHEKVMYR